MDTSPETAKSSADTMYQMLRAGLIKEFNARRMAGEVCELRGADLRGLDLRNLDTQGLDLRGCYLRHADLRGLDLTQAMLEGASISSAKISGTYFPEGLTAEEINLSLQHGTRFRYRLTVTG